jgi:hypothetical protein
MDRSSEAILPRPTGGRRNARSVIFALRPRSYSEAISETVAALRPGLEVSAVDPDAIAAEVGRRAPALVFSAAPKPEGMDAEVGWVQFRPHEAPDILRLDGVPRRYPGLGLGACWS